MARILVNTKFTLAKGHDLEAIRQPAVEIPQIDQHGNKWLESSSDSYR